MERDIAEEETGPGALPPAADSAEGGQAAARREMAFYLLTAAAAMAALYIAAFFIARSPLYDRVNPSFYARPLNYAFETAGENADVVIFGDSTALLGIDPSQMSSELGVKVLNLVNTQPSLVVNDDMSLRHYLRENRAPRLLIFYFAPWDFDYGHNDFYSRPTYEGEELLLRRGSLPEMRAFASRHPREAVLFPLQFYATAWQFTLHHLPVRDQETQLRETRGHVGNTDPSVLGAACRFPQYLADNVRFAWVRDLGRRYRSAETQVMFFVAPVPACENVAEVLNRPYGELPADPPRAAPPELFTDDVRFIHPRAMAVPRFTRELADAARPLLAAR